MLRAALISIALAGGWPQAAALADDSVDTLRHNPFTRPELGDAAAMGGDPAVPAVTEPELRATLVGGDTPLANVGGELIGVGEQIDGYRLLRVGEGFAEFQKGDEQTTIFIRAAAPKRTKGRR